MPDDRSARLWPNSTSVVLDESGLREWCGRATAGCAELAERVPGVFGRGAADAAAVLAELAGLRAEAVCWDGHQAVRLAAEPDDAERRDLRLLAGAALDEVDEVLALAEQDWLALPDAAADALLAAPELAGHRHYLAAVRSLAPYTLAEPVEAALAARETAAGTAWVELYYQVSTRLRPEVAGAAMTAEQARSLLEQDDAERRAASLDALYRALEPVAPVLAVCLDSLVADKLAVDELRGVPHPRAERDLTNELPSPVVDEMLAVVEEHRDLAQRWFARKARLLGTDRLRFSDIRAPVGAGPRIPFEAAVRAVAAAFDEFAPEAGDLVRAMVADGHVDAEPRPGKQAGAFCRSLGPGQPPRIVVSYFGTVEDVIGLAHEFGHALHFTLAGRERDGLSFDAPLSLNEVAPAFTELLVQDWLIAHERDPAARRVLAAKRADTCIDAIFMSTFLTRFEERAHQLRAAGAPLTDERIRELWRECGAPLYEPAVALPERWGLHWALVPHLVHERFCSYPYAFARLVGLDLHASYRRDPAGFAPRLLAALGRGGSAGPAEQLADLGIDLADREIWYRGLKEFAALLDPLLAD